MIKPVNKTSAIIVAAGRSGRMGGADKLFLRLGNRPLLYWCLAAFETCPLVDEIVLVMNSSNLPRGKELVSRYGLGKVKSITEGGSRRRDSVQAGLQQASGQLILIHDGARPLVSSQLIAAVIEETRLTGACVPGVPVSDTIKQVLSDRIVETLPRHTLYAIQTPQGFLYNVIAGAYNRTSDDATDDAALVEAGGGTVSLVTGCYDNIKITTPSDLELARILLKKRGG